MSNEANESNLNVSDVEIKQTEQLNEKLKDDYVRESCWKVKLNHKYTNKPMPFMRPRLKQVAKFVCMGIRYFRNCYFNQLKDNLMIDIKVSKAH